MKKLVETCLSCLTTQGDYRSRQGGPMKRRTQHSVEVHPARTGEMVLERLEERVVLDGSEWYDGNYHFLYYDENHFLVEDTLTGSWYYYDNLGSQSWEPYQSWFTDSWGASSYNDWTYSHYWWDANHYFAMSHTDGSWIYYDNLGSHTWEPYQQWFSDSTGLSSYNDWDVSYYITGSQSYYSDHATGDWYYQSGSSWINVGGVDQTVEDWVLYYVNQYRAAYGLQALQACSSLDYIAEGHNQNMITYNTFDHTVISAPAGWVTFQDRADLISMGYGSENIYWQSSDWESYPWTAQETGYDIATAWYNSSGHRANMLDPNMYYCAVGADKGYVTMNYSAALLGLLQPYA